MKALNLQRLTTCPQWSYIIRPTSEALSCNTLKLRS